MGFGGGGGVATFIELEDTPEAYAGLKGKLAKVKDTEDGLELALLLSFTDWYTGALPTDFPWVFEANVPEAWNNISISPILKNEIGQYIVYITGYEVQTFYRYNLDTKQWHRLADPPVVLITPLALSPNETKLAAQGQNSNILYIYNIETNAWSASPTAPQIATVDVIIQSKVWADDDTIWCAVRTTVVKCFKYVVSTTTWSQFANSITPAIKNSQGMGITPDEATLYFGNCGADYHTYTKYVISTDTYTYGDLGSQRRFFNNADRTRLWYTFEGDYAFHYFKCEDETTHTNQFPANPQRDKASNWYLGVYELSVAICTARINAPRLMSYSGTGYWKLAEKVLTDYNLVVFKKPADGYAILAIDKVSGFTVPIYLMSTQTLPAGTWEFFYPKDGDYTQLVISGSELK